MKSLVRVFFIIVSVLFIMCCCEKGGSKIQENNIVETSNWWPIQATPRAIAICKVGQSHGEWALIHSLAGLVAQAQKEDKVDELIWIEAHGDYDMWYSKLIERTKAEELGEFDVWRLLERYKNQVKGYIIYQEESNAVYRNGMDMSYHVAVSYAGLKQAIIIDTSLEDKVKSLGFKKLLDAREVSRYQCYEDVKYEANNEIIVTMNPVYHNNSDLAIANKALITYGTDYLSKMMMDREKPVSPVVGWNAGEEYEFTQLPSRHGLFNTASDWCNNLVALSAGAEESQPEKIKTIDPKSIDFDSKGHYHSFVMSDGDNMQWSINGFINNNKYWGSPLNQTIPMGFTSCPINLSMMAPDVLDELAKTQRAHTTVIEYGGGYQYPDMFAIDEGAYQEDIQREFARKVNARMKQTGIKVFGFICIDVTSNAAQAAYQIYAEEIEDLTGMFAVQYSPYHGGNGAVMWVTNKDGEEIPVISARYSLWKDLNMHRGGNVEDVVKAVNDDISAADETFDWTIVHAWSQFENPNNPAEVTGGLKPVKWCIDGFNEKIKVVSPEELLWRLRMKHNPEETLRIINK